MFVVLFAVLCLGWGMAGTAAEDPTDSLPGVQDLTPETFDNVVNGKVHALVEFYAPWCGHCKSLTPELKKLGEEVMSDPKLKNRVVIAKVNADAHRALGTQFDVKGFPTLKWFSRGKPTSSPEDYNSDRKLDAFLGFIRDKLEADKGFGRLDVLDAIVQNFLTGDKDSVIREVEEKIREWTGEDQEKGAVYLKLMQKTKEKGNDYLTTERARVMRVIDSGNVNEEKVAELSRKISIISAFVPEQ